MGVSIRLHQSIAEFRHLSSRNRDRFLHFTSIFARCRLDYFVPWSTLRYIDSLDGTGLLPSTRPIGNLSLALLPPSLPHFALPRNLTQTDAHSHHTSSVNDHISRALQGCSTRRDRITIPALQVRDTKKNALTFLVTDSRGRMECLQ